MMKYGSLYIVAIVGCILWACSPNQQLTDEVVESPVFDLHIAPIIHDHCVRCHRENGGAPFALTSYEAVKKKAKTIAKVTRMRVMPPWPADPNYSHFLGENRLSEAQIQTIQNWVSQGCAKGENPNKLLATVKPFQSALGVPDMVLDLDTVSLTQGGSDRFFLSAVSRRIAEKKYVRAVEIIPGERRLMHHFNGHLINYDKGSKRNFANGSVKVEITDGKQSQNMEALNLMTDNGQLPERVHSVVNYLPGVSGVMYPEGIGTFQLSEEFTIIGKDVHYGPSPKTVVDKSKINLFFTQVPPKRGLGEIMLGTNGVSKIVPPLRIPPNKISTHTTEFLVPEDISVLTVNPHLHLLGKSITAFAIKPNGDTIKIIHIGRWDFRWQFYYTFPTMLKIPRGSVIKVIAVFDNTSANPLNPNKPPKEVGERWDYGGSSMRASDEMFQFIITYLGYKPGDEQISLDPKK